MKYIFEYWAEIGGILGIVGTPLGFLFGRKRAMAETQITRSDMIKSMQSAYDGWVDDDKERYAALKEDVEDLKKELTLTRKENLQQREEIRIMRKAQEVERKEYQVLMKKNLELEKKYNSLKSAFDRLKTKYDKVNQTSSDGK